MKVDQYTIPMMTTEALEAALQRTTDKRKRDAIQAELNARKAGFVTIEDYL